MSLLSWLWSGFGSQPNPTGAGFASGLGTATAVGVRLGINASVGAASGVATATATVITTRTAAGTAHGTSTADAVNATIIIGPGILQSLSLEFAIGDGAFFGQAFNTSAFGGSGWVPVTSDVRSEDPIVLDYGVQGHGPSDRVAGTGTMTFTLNNAIDNLGGVEGFYSPLNALKRTGHDVNVAVRLVLGINGQTYHKFLGRLADINPEPGRNGTFRVPCTAVDMMDDWAANDVPSVIPIMADQNTGILIAYLLLALNPVPDLVPATASVETGVDTVPFAFHDPGRRKIREVLTDLVMSELGFAAITGGTYSAGQFTFYNRHAATTYAVSAFLINQFLVDGGFISTTSRDDLASSVEVFVYPTSVDDLDVDILKLDGSPLLVLPFNRPVVRLPFRNANQPNAPIAALSLVPFEPHVDFTINTQANGLGNDLTDEFTVVHLYPAGGTEAVIEIANFSSTPGFVTLLKGRGKGLYISEASAKVDLDTAYGRRPLQVVMPLQANANTAADIAHYFANIYQSPYGQVESIRFCANKTDTLMSAAIFLEPGALVYIEETVTGIAGTFRIQGVHLEFHNGLVWCTWRLAGVVRQKFWLLGITDASELGLFTILGF